MGFFDRDTGEVVSSPGLFQEDGPAERSSSMADRWLAPLPPAPEPFLPPDFFRPAPPPRPNAPPRREHTPHDIPLLLEMFGGYE